MSTEIKERVTHILQAREKKIEEVVVGNFVANDIFVIPKNRTQHYVAFLPSTFLTLEKSAILSAAHTVRLRYERA